MGIYNRLRVLLMDPSIPVRDSAACRAKYDHFFEDAYYAGWQVHHYSGPNPAHLYLVDDPTERLIANFLLCQREGLPVRLFREYIGQDNEELSFNSILADIACVLQRDFVESEGPDSESNKIARCWSGAKVLALAAGVTF